MQAVIVQVVNCQVAKRYSMFRSKVQFLCPHRITQLCTIVVRDLNSSLIPVHHDTRILFSEHH